MERPFLEDTRQKCEFAVGVLPHNSRADFGHFRRNLLVQTAASWQVSSDEEAFS